MALILILILTSIYFLFLLLKEKRPKNFPPGPVGYPVIGCLPYLGPEPYINIGKIGKEFGNIFSMKLGSYWYVVLNDFDTIRNALKEEVFSGRPNQVLRMSLYTKGIAFNTGPSWQAQRIFSLKVLRDFGFGKNSMLSSIQIEVNELVEHLKKNTGTPIDICEIFPISILNSLWSIVAGEKFLLHDPLPNKIYQATKTELQGQDVLGILYFLPWLRTLLPGQISGVTKAQAAIDNLRALLKSIIDEHRQRFIPCSTPTDYIDTYLQQIEDTVDPNSSFYKDEGVNNLIDSVINFFIAGSDTISSSMSFALLYVSSNRDVMKKVHDEIDSVICRKRQPDPTDRAQMPYMSAVVNETFRLSSILPGDLLHCTTEETEFGGYTLPKGTIVMLNLYQVHHDEKYWGDPKNFRPERFLNPDGSFRKDERVIPFAVGKRVCVAENLAQVEFFMFLTGVLQNCDLLERPDHPLPSFKAKSSFVLSPQPYKVVLRERI